MPLNPHFGGWVIIERNREGWRALINTVARTRREAMRRYQLHAPASRFPKDGVTWYHDRYRRGLAKAMWFAGEAITFERSEP
jgi:hypothetical protein